jgi:hypothetical protein
MPYTLQMKARLLTAVAILLCTATLRAADRPTSLPPIPDVGEPFDVKSFISVPFSYRNNAFTSYRHASLSYVAPLDAVKAKKERGPRFDSKAFNTSLNETLEKGWSHANADVRKWLAANEFGLEIWHRGTECAVAMDIPPADIHAQFGGFDLFPEIRAFARLARLEASRVAAEGKPADAWSWHRAALRSGVHLAMCRASRYRFAETAAAANGPVRTELVGRLLGMAVYTDTAAGVRRWAARPELSASDLRRALADVIAVNDMMPPPSDALKGSYLAWRRKTDQTTAVKVSVSYPAPVSELLGYPERARRILNLVYANLLSQADRLRFRRTAVRGTLGLFGRGPVAPVNAKVYLDEEIEGKFLASPADLKIARLILPPNNVVDIFDTERVQQAALVLGLALQLHHREHGQFPVTLAELVKSGYLKSIPPDPFGKGEPFHYHCESGSRQVVVLWSVWTDGIDQEGKVDAWQSPDNNGDCIFKIDAPR